MNSQKTLKRKPTIGELADSLDRSRSSIFTSLESLKKRGILIENENILEASTLGDNEKTT